MLDRLKNGALVALLCAAVLFGAAVVAQATTDGYAALRQAMQPSGGLYTTTLPSLSTGEHNEIHLDSASRQIVSVGPPCSVDVNAGQATDVDAAVAAATGLRLMGFSIRESASTAAVATCAVVHGATANGGTVITRIELLPNESRSEWFGPNGIAAASGLSVDITAGTVDADLYYAVVIP